MSRPRGRQAGGFLVGRLSDQSGGMVDGSVYPTLLNDNQASGLLCVSLDERGTVKTSKGRIRRFTTPFDANNPCNGITAFYPDTTTSRLVMGAGTRLFSDTPHLVHRWTDQAHFEEAGALRVNTDTVSVSGDIREATPSAPTATFTRASTKHQHNGVAVASGTPTYEVGKFATGVHVEEGTTNLLTANQASVETDLTGFAANARGSTLTRDTTQTWQLSLIHI